MRELKWIKLSLDIFNNRKIKCISKEKRGDKITLIWIKLLCLAGQINDGGEIYIDKSKSLTPKLLSVMIDSSKELISEALSLFSEFSMITYTPEGVLIIKNWNEYQDSISREEATTQVSVRKMNEEEKRSYFREAKKRSRENASANESTGDFVSYGDRMSEEQNAVSNSMSNSMSNTMSNSMSNTAFDKSNTSLKYLSLEENREEKNIIDDMRIEERERDSASDCNASYGEDSIKGEPSNCASLTLASPSLTQESKKAINSVERNLNDAGRGRFRNVFITDDEYSELLQKYPKTTDVLIDDFSSHMKGMGKTYSNHFAMLLRWAKNDYAPKVRGEPEINPSGSSGQGASDNGEYGRGANAEYGKGYMDKHSYNKPPKTRYGDFDPEEAFRIALERTEKDSLKHKSSESEKG